MLLINSPFGGRDILTDRTLLGATYHAGHAFLLQARGRLLQGAMMNIYAAASDLHPGSASFVLEHLAQLRSKLS